MLLRVWNDEESEYFGYLEENWLFHKLTMEVDWEIIRNFNKLFHKIRTSITLDYKMKTHSIG
jgi:hypothetical protein